MMFGCNCFYWNTINDFSPPLQPQTYSLPAPIPKWPEGESFASGRISLGELEVIKITRFEFIWGYNLSQEKTKGLTFYKPVGIPEGFYCLGHYCQPNNQPLRGFVLVAREVPIYSPGKAHTCDPVNPPALQEPLDYTLVWSPNDGSDEKSRFPNSPFQVWSTRPHHRGMQGKGVSVGTFFCSSYWTPGEQMCIACLKNLNPTLPAMPNLDQIHALIHHYGPTVFFHPEELFMPSSVSWFLKNGAQLFRAGMLDGEEIDANGSNLPGGGTNDGQFWIDLPSDDRRETGSSKLGIGVRNDCARSNLFVDSSIHYELVAAEYFGEGVVTEPFWLQFMREWGPTIVYDSRTELDKIINRLPVMLRYSVENIFDKLPVELYGEEGPTGPKEKNNWVGDERS
ncbi:hypothetical protein FCV25MIE_01448 [Fagus crenata]